MKTCSRCGRALTSNYFCAGCGNNPNRCRCKPNALLEDF